MVLALVASRSKSFERLELDTPKDLVDAVWASGVDSGPGGGNRRRIRGIFARSGRPLGSRFCRARSPPAWRDLGVAQLPLRTRTGGEPKPSRSGDRGLRDAGRESGFPSDP